MNGSVKWMLVPAARRCELGKTCARLSSASTTQTNDTGRKLWQQTCGAYLAAQDETAQSQANLPVIETLTPTIDPAAMAQPQGYRLRSMRKERN